MSDDFIVLVPRDPSYAAPPDVQQRVAAVLKRLAPSADKITPEVSETIRFHDAGASFENIRCPRCGAEISIDWWQDRMDDDFEDDGFRLSSYAVPCCGVPLTLNQLTYEWPQAFGRTSWTVQNADIGEIDAAGKTELEQAAGFSLTVVRQHL
jgi:hypothetical protein